MTESAAPEAPDAPDAKLAKVQTQRARWATRKMTVKSSSSKRMSILNRMQHKRGMSNEKNPSGGSPQPPADGDDEDDQDPAGSDQNDEEESAGRQLYVNIPLPDELLEDGHPLYTYPRNKIRTAKYTPLSFVPKNLYFQFQNVANIFFLFLIIMGVSFYNSVTNSARFHIIANTSYSSSPSSVD